MKIWEHFVSGIILSIVLFPIFKWDVLVILIINSIVDIDHIFRYWEKRGFSLNMSKIERELTDIYKSEKSKRMIIYNSLAIFHTLEMLIFAWIVSWIYGYYPIAIGFTIHLIMDYEGIFRKMYKLSKKIESSPEGRAISLVDWFRRVYFEKNIT